MCVGVRVRGKGELRWTMKMGVQVERGGEGGGEGRFVAKRLRLRRGDWLALALGAGLLYATAVYTSWDNVERTCPSCGDLLKCLRALKTCELAQ